MKKLAVLGLLGVLSVVACQAAESAPDPSNATYSIDQRRVTLANGQLEEPAAPGSAAKVTTRLLDKRAAGDLSADGKPDTAVVLTVSGGGTGTFYYLAVLLGTGGGQGMSTNAVLLGDRIVVEAVRADAGKVTVDTLERKAGEPFTTAPSVKTSRIFQVKGGALAEVR